MRFVIPPLAVALLAATLAAAPALKSDMIEGELRILSGSDPVLIRQERTPEGTFVDVTYWLVFPDKSAERDAANIGEGAMVKVVGTIGRGGQYRYVAVERVTKKE